MHYFVHCRHESELTNSNSFKFLLKGDNDFKLEEFLAGTPETFEPHYGKSPGARL